MREKDCTGFVRGAVDFPQSNWYGAVFWICYQNSVVQSESEGILYLFLQNFRTFDTEIIPL